MDIKDRIKNDFTFHSPPPYAIKQMQDLRDKITELALLIAETVPSGREQSSALTKLEEAMFHANAGISRQYPASKRSTAVAPRQVNITRPYDHGRGLQFGYSTSDGGGVINIPSSAVITGDIETFVNDELKKIFGNDILILRK